MKKILFWLSVFLLVGFILFLGWRSFRHIDYPPKNYLKEPATQVIHLPFHQEVEMDGKNNYFIFPFVGPDGQESVLRIIGWPYGTDSKAFYVDILKKSDPNILQLPSQEKLVFCTPIVNGFVDPQNFEHFQKDLATINDHPIEEINGKGFYVKVKKISSEYYLPKGLEATITYKRVKFEVIVKNN